MAIVQTLGVPKIEVRLSHAASCQKRRCSSTGLFRLRPADEGGGASLHATQSYLRAA